MGHTKEPWEAVTPCPGECCWSLQQVGNENGAFGHISHPEMSKDDALRIVACVNACEGSPTEALEEMQKRSLTLGQLAFLYSKSTEQQNELVISENNLRQQVSHLTDQIAGLNSTSALTSKQYYKLLSALHEIIEELDCGLNCSQTNIRHIANTAIEGTKEGHEGILHSPETKTSIPAIVFYPAGSLGEETAP